VHGRAVPFVHFDSAGIASRQSSDAAGTYRINPDCTGEAEIIIPGSPFSPVILRLVVGDKGTQIRTVGSKPGYVVTSSGTKVAQSR
jgi:hypothetical protein